MCSECDERAAAAADSPVQPDAVYSPRTDVDVQLAHLWQAVGECQGHVMDLHDQADGTDYGLGVAFLLIGSAFGLLLTVLHPGAVRSITTTIREGVTS